MSGKARRKQTAGVAKATLEAVAKATYEHKKKITEVIPADVTRAKAGRWLDLISPITEWSGLKGDALRYKRQQLRIQQEAALENLALSIREKMAGKIINRPLEPKFVVPALEAASLEAPQSPLLDWWADLLVAGATGRSIRPYFIDLMKVLGPQEANLLNELWTNFSSFDVQHGMIYDYLAIRFRDLFEEKERAKIKDEEQINGFYKKWREDLKPWAEDRGLLMTVNFGTENSTYREFFFDRRSEAVDVCIAANLLSRRDFEYEDDECGLRANVLIFSELGVEFMSACRPPAVMRQRGKMFL